MKAVLELEHRLLLRDDGYMLTLRGFLLLTLCLSLPLFASAGDAPLRVALFADAGSGRGGITNVTEQLRRAGMEAVHVTGQEIASGALSRFDAVVFTGGSGSKQAASLGETGREQVRQFVRSGGGYVGICAGAYLACNGFSWGVGVLDARTVDSRWRRGEGMVEVEFAAGSRKITGLSEGKQQVRYANGPILTPNGDPAIPDFQPLAYFRTELAKNGTPEGIMVNSPALAQGTYGKGKVIVSSPHPESTPGLNEAFAPAAVKWVARRPQSQARTKVASTRR